jgi:hypothetical protein
LASLQSLITQLPAYTFNAAGLSPDTWERAGITDEQAKLGMSMIHAYDVNDELLGNVQHLPILPSAAGDRIGLIPVSFNDEGVNTEVPIPSYDYLNPSEMSSLHAATEVIRALNYQLTQTHVSFGGQ